MNSPDPESVETDPLKIFHTAIENTKPIVGIQTFKKGSKNFQVCILFRIKFM